jgi:RimJ/RimL family protein N-acetyltransferase
MLDLVDDRWAKPTIEGELVVLRPLGGGDAEAVWEMVNDPESNDLTHTTATFTREQIEEWCATRPAAPDRLDLGIVERATGQFAGEVVLNEHDAERNSANFRIGLRGPAWFGRGLGGEATRLIVRHGFEVVGLDEITLEVLARNARARRAYERAGFEVTGTFDDEGESWVAMAIRRAAPPA